MKINDVELLEELIELKTTKYRARLSRIGVHHCYIKENNTMKMGI